MVKRIAVLVTLFALAVAWLPAASAPVWGQTSTLEPHDPILIEGDGDLCDDEDGDGVVGLDDGIVNCATANGTARAPYVISGWTLANDPGLVCTSAVDPGCLPPAHCSAVPNGATIMLCNITRHVVVRDVEVLNVLANEGIGAEQAVPAAVGIHEAGNVTLEDATLTAAGYALHATQGRPGATVTLERVHAAATVPDEHTPAVPQSLEPLLRVEGYSVTMANSTIRADRHYYGLHVQGSVDANNATLSTLIVQGSAIGNATAYGIFANDMTARVSGNRFSENGYPHDTIYHEDGAGPGSIQVGAHVSLQVGTATVHVQDNTFHLRGAGLTITSSGTGTVLGNRFIGSDRQTALLYHSSDQACLLTASFNDLNAHRVGHVGNCILDASRNWWGTAAGPEDLPVVPDAGVSVRADPWLALPIEKLPRVAIVQPAPNAEIVGRAKFSGTASDHADNPIARIEVSEKANEWGGAHVADGTLSWEFEIALDDGPRVPRTFWFRACGTIECGPPETITVHERSHPVPPVAVLSASRDVVTVNEATTLDASASYHPAGLQVAAYRFHAGNGMATEWTDAPKFTTTYDESGAYWASVEVRDETGAISINQPAVSVHVRAVGDRIFPDGLDERRGLPFPTGPWLTSMVLLALAVAHRRWPG